ncbi:isopentenyl-diphosphate Delta-isomerase [Rhodococcus sp. 06-470-2]|jgi:isopentenyl-diphosphate delta-isomerase|uniref:isopentenyl-diphosphate Delta-isomerase n=1 Tax=Nocardiaceae TaxID=85025 RepID=UPI00050CEC11|nr:MULTISPECIES: isopentenyl-diphosphate Delta-isomerase [Rhodococcus]OZC58520.1 isopentenyl-diphosphate Delta-isomerase [Rhodococcus sp. 06-470-2]OZD77440.1 isopentenyl-diphosphate Delta-isomerase [Rhodococcus sp. 05-339-2]OZE05728.1 isopentenyl-diphosphate Delta-isomerase [Rhodococcus sp. 05-2255-3B1]OZE08934.1 isopentenyl-diphosphate Delta-isomerase [Rhodococcus sp. 05-2255-3C]OZE17881.1 isopentenyl-diphosphate Delta-isomerase [Rhodococcus sp. 05-2255-2A2]
MDRSRAQHVVLLDDEGRAVGTHDKTTVHTLDTPLHLAFSSYVVRADGAVLLTRRASSKTTWPGVLTNTCCGHPAPGEKLDDAVLRRIGEELGLRAESAELVLPHFRYRAVMDNGIVENEICPVYRVQVDEHATLDPDPAEVDETRWVSWREFSAGVLGGTIDVSPWCRTQVEQLAALADEPLGWPASPDDLLPPAARPADTR